MDKEILDTLNKSLADTKIDKISPNQELLDVVLSLQGNKLAALTEPELTNYIFVLSQYQLFLQTQSNYRHIRYMEAKREFEFSLAREVSKLEGKTIKEKEAKALSDNLELQLLEKAMRVRQADHILFDKVPENLSEMANALKKELSLRSTTLNPGNRYGR